MLKGLEYAVNLSTSVSQCLPWTRKFMSTFGRFSMASLKDLRRAFTNVSSNPCNDPVVKPSPTYYGCAKGAIARFDVVTTSWDLRDSVKVLQREAVAERVCDEPKMGPQRVYKHPQNAWARPDHLMEGFQILHGQVAKSSMSANASRRLIDDLMSSRVLHIYSRGLRRPVVKASRRILSCFLRPTIFIYNTQRN